MALTKVSGGILDPGINVAGVVTATGFDGPFIGGGDGVNAGVGTFTGLDVNGNVDISGNLVVQGDTTTLNTTLRNVELLRVSAASTLPAGIITQTSTGDILNLYDGSTEVFSVADGGVLTITGKGNIINGDPSTDFGLAIRNKSTSGFSTSEGIEGTTNRKLTPLMIRNAGATANTETYLGFDAGNTSKAQWNIGVKKTGSLQGDFIFNTRTGSSTSAERLRISSSGNITPGSDNSQNIGDGSSNFASIWASTRFRGNDNVKLVLGDSQNLVIRHDGAYNIIGSPVADDLHIKSGTLDNDNQIIASFKHSNGSVGIGTTNPTKLLELYGTDPTIKLRDSSGDAYALIEGDFADEGSIRFRADPLSAGGSTHIRFDTDGSERLRITNDGKLGVNYNSPVTIIHAIGNGTVGTSVTMTLQSHDTANATAGINLLARRNDNVNETCKIQAASGGQNSVDLQFYTNSNERLRITSGGGLQFRNADTPTNNTEPALILNHAGGWQFYASSDNSTHNNIIFGTNNVAAGERLRITTAGKVVVGYGGTDASLLNVKGSAGFADDGTNAGIIIATDDANGAGIHCVTTGGFANGGYGIMRFNASQHKFTYGNTQRLLINASGKAIFSEEIETPQDYPDLRPRLDFNFAAEKKFDSRITYQREGPASFTDELGKVVLVGEDVPKFDHDPSTGESKGLLLEAIRTNQMIYSSDITEDVSQNSGYTVTNGTVTGDQTTAPDGTTTADQFAANSTNNIHRVSIYFTSGQISNSTAYTFSVFVKANGYDKLHIRYGGYNADNHGLGYDLSDGTTFAGKFDGTGSLGAVTSSSMIAYPNGWYRCSFTFTTASDAATGSAGIFYYISNSESTTSFAGDGSSGMYFWGAQMEVGSFPTSYIPTNGSTATRGNEHVVIDGEDFSDFYNPSESSVLAVGTMQRPAADQGQLNIFHIGDNNEDGHGVFREHGTKDVWYHIRNNNSTPSGGNLNPNGFGDWDAGEEARIAIAFKDGDQAISVNGGNQITATVTSSYPTADITKMWIGSHGNGSYFEGHIKRIAYYPKLLTDNQLNTLTA